MSVTCMKQNVHSDGESSLRWMNELMNEWMNEWMEWNGMELNEWMNEINWMKWMNEGRKEGRNEWTNEWMNEWETEAEGDVSGRTFSSQDHPLVYTFQNTVFIHNYHIFQEFPRYYDNDMLLTIIDYHMRRCFCSRRVEVEEPVEALVPVLVEVEAVAASRLRGKHWRCGAAVGTPHRDNMKRLKRDTAQHGTRCWDNIWATYVLRVSMCIYL